VARPELGTKHTCPECEKKYYDLNKANAVCPSCGHTIATEQDAPEEKEIPVEAKPANGLKPPETGDDFDADEAGVIDDDKDIADLNDDDDKAAAEAKVETAVETDEDV